MHRKNEIKIDQTSTAFYLKIDLKLIKTRLLLWKKLEIQVIVLIITLTRSSERTFNPMRYIGQVSNVQDDFRHRDPF